MVQDTSASLLASLRGARLFRGVEARVLEPLARSAHTTTLREGECLWQAGQAARFFCVIQRGLIQIERAVGGREPAILGIFGPRESVGDSAALGRTVYPAQAVAASEQVQVIKIPSEVLLNTMEREPSLARALEQALLAHTQALTAKIDIISAGSVSARLATLMLHLSERFGDEQEEGHVVIPLSLSRAALARLVSARVETVIRALGTMRKAGWLDDAPEGIALLDVGALRAAAAEG